ncbi:hypothetical protein [Anaerosporobacter sp.]|uniref:hypothetical protein n=1 Tax=Anaerosporobacter sp. TaxID=1872529 RepID=UPI00286EDB2D|nr:hypothetical protein [Anaerosporobacter sp.]
MAINKDKLKLHLYIDETQDEEEAYAYPFAVPYTAEGNTGWYMMPQIGEKAVLYIPSEDEMEAYISTVSHGEAENNDYMTDESVHRIGTEDDMSLVMKQDELSFQSEANEFFITMTANEGISVVSENNIHLVAEKSGSLQAESINMYAKDRITLTTKKTSIIMDNVVDISGDNQKKSTAEELVYRLGNNEKMTKEAYTQASDADDTEYNTREGMAPVYLAGKSLEKKAEEFGLIEFYKKETIKVNTDYRYDINNKYLLQLYFKTGTRSMSYRIYRKSEAEVVGRLYDSHEKLICQSENKEKKINIDMHVELEKSKKYQLAIMLKDKQKKSVKVRVDEKIEIAPWLIGYRGKPHIPKDSGAKKVTYSFDEREKLKKIKGVKNIDWYSYEKQEGPNRYTKPFLEGKEFKVGDYGELTDDDKRYWVTLGPKVFIPDYSNEGPLDTKEFADYIPCRVDVVLYNKKENEHVYIECVYSGHIKAHTLPNGVYQTGHPYPKSSSASAEPYKVDYVDGSIVEFTGARPIANYKEKTEKERELEPACNGTMSKYIVEELVVYPKNWKENE